jgi:hypothetical protein
MVTEITVKSDFCLAVKVGGFQDGAELFLD